MSIVVNGSGSLSSGLTGCQSYNLSVDVTGYNYNIYFFTIAENLNNNNIVIGVHNGIASLQNPSLYVYDDSNYQNVVSPVDNKATINFYLPNSYVTNEGNTNPFNLVNGNNYYISFFGANSASDIHYFFYELFTYTAPPQFVHNNFKFTPLNNSYVSVDGFVDSTGVTTLVVPETATDTDSKVWNVTAVSRNAFNVASLTSITVKSNITSFFALSFAYCTSLTSLILEEGLVTLADVNNLFTGWSGFNGCTSLTSVTIPSTVKFVGEYAFGDCSSLTTVTFSATTLLPTTIYSNAFNGGSTVARGIYNSSVTNANDNSILDQDGSTHNISFYFVNGASAVGATTFNDGNFVYTILDSTTARLDSAVAPSATYLFKPTATDPGTSTIYNVVEINAGAFLDDTTVTNILVPSSVIKIGSGAFEGCTNLEYVSFKHVTELPEIDLNAFLTGFSTGTKAQHNDSVTNLNAIPNGSGVTVTLSSLFGGGVTDLIIYSGSSGTGSGVTTLYSNSNNTISFTYNLNQFPLSDYIAQWFTLGYANADDGNVNISDTGGTGSFTDPTTYTYTGGNLTVDQATGLVSTNFYLPPIGTVLTNSQYPSPFTLEPGTYYLGAWVYSNATSSVQVANFKIQVQAELVCFKEDSKILTNNGYVAVQNLRNGDLVKTSKNGFVPVHAVGKRRIQHVASESRIKDQLYKCSKDKYPELTEDLVITGCHSILVDNFTSQAQREKTIQVNGAAYVTDRKYRLPACVDDKTTVYEKAGSYNIYHFALENEDYYMNYGVYANGLLVETCSKRYLKELSNMELL